MPFTNLLTNMVLLTVTGLDVIVASSPAFQHYALHTTITNAQVIATKLHLDTNYMATHKITAHLEPDLYTGIVGGITFGDRYYFGGVRGRFGGFVDIWNDPQAHTNLILDPSMHNSLTMKKALKIATDAMEAMGLPRDRKGFGKPREARQYTTLLEPGSPLPMYYFEWKSSQGYVEFDVSGVISNVVRFRCGGPYLQLEVPTNYYEILGIPKNPILVESVHQGSTNPPYQIVTDEPPEKWPRLWLGWPNK